MAKNVTPDELVDELTKDFEALFRGIGVEASNRIIDKAPVSTGALRASIRASVNSEIVSYSKDDVDPSGQKTKLFNESAIRDAKDGDLINIVVGAPYGKQLEEGTSTRAPLAFVRSTGEELSSIVETVIANLRKYRD